MKGKEKGEREEGGREREGERERGGRERERGEGERDIHVLIIIILVFFSFFVKFEARDFSHLPPEQRRKKLAKKINELEAIHSKLTSDK